MPGTILVCYDVETASQSTLGFFDGAIAMHEQLDIPCTMFLTGTTMEAYGDACQAADQHPLIWLGQHTYNHVLLKTVYMQPGDGKPCSHTDGDATFLIEGSDLETIESDVVRAQQLYEKLFGRACHGMTAPWGYYRGLLDRPDILRVLDEIGLTWIRSYARDYRDCQPTPFEIQPFFYEDQGFGDFMEIPVQGYQDDFYWDRFDDRSHGPNYADYLAWAIEHVVANDFVWCLSSHDHATETAEAFEAIKGVWLRAALKKAMSVGARFTTCEALYQERLAQREAKHV